MTDIQNIKNQLLSLRKDMTKRSDAISKDIHHTEYAVEKDFAEQATQLENDEVLNSLDDEARSVIMQIDKSLLRIKDGTFGLCVDCGNKISDERLQAIPYASLCINCAD